MRKKLDGEASEAAEEALRELHYHKCGKCGHNMNTELYRGVEIEVCSNCKAVLLDPGELEALSGRDEGFFTVGDIGEEGSVLASMPWGIVSLVDVYVGFILFSGWVVYREKSLVRSVVWVVLIMVLGNFTASLYTLLALQTSGGDWWQFWMGRRLETGYGE